MTITITKWKLAIAVLAIALVAPTTAVAFHVFDDVPDDKFYAGPVEWAAANNITTGKSPTIFDPEGNVTRGESVTFLNRYDTNIAQPALTGLQAEVDATEAATAANTAAIAANTAALPVLRWAVVEGDGNLARTSAGVTSSAKITTGGYEVIFDLDVTECSYVASSGNSGAATPPANFVVTASRGGNAMGAYVQTYSDAGVATDHAFHIQVMC